MNGKFISVDGYERVPVFALCTEKKANPLYSKEGQGLNAEVIARFFLPFSSVVWLVTEAEQQEDGDWLFFGYCHIQEWEWGYVLLSQIQEVNVRGLTVQLDKGLKTGITVKACLN